MTTTTENAAAIVALSAKVAEMTTDSHAFYLLWAGVLLFSMQVSRPAGLSFLYSYSM